MDKMSEIANIICRNCKNECSNDDEFCSICIFVRSFRLKVKNTNISFSEPKLDSPGFELIMLLVGILSFILYRKKYN